MVPGGLRASFSVPFIPHALRCVHLLHVWRAVNTSIKLTARRIAAPVLGALGLHGRRERHVFADRAPNPQDTVDIFQGQWITAFPPELGVSAGAVNHFDPTVDPRVPWVAEQLSGGLQGRSVLELGPFEGYQTALLERSGAQPIIAVEGSQTAYLKCLVVKELLNLKASFLYGDVLRFLDSTTEHFDVVWASGILYHQTDPLGLLERIAPRTDRIFLHTHCIDPERTVHGPADRRLDPTGDVHQTWRGRDVHLHRYRYVDDFATKGFAGGPRRYALWMERADIEYALTELGFTNIRYGVIDINGPAGSAFFCLASRPGCD